MKKLTRFEFRLAVLPFCWEVSFHKVKVKGNASAYIWFGPILLELGYSI